MATESTITGRVAEMRASMAAQPPNEVMGAFAREQAALAAAGIPDGVAAPGTLIPDAGLLDVHGSPTTLHTVTADRPAVLVFYRGAWCPYCNIALSAYQQHLLPRLTGRGVGLVAIARGLGILTRPSDEARAAQLQLGLDLTAVNADGTVALPMPTVVIADAGHVVRWIDVHPDYSTRTEPAQILSALDRLDI